MATPTRHRRSKKTRRSLRSKILLVVIAIGVLSVVASTSLLAGHFGGATAAAQGNDISPEALAQIEALINEKDSRGPIEKKMDSQLIYELKMERGQAIADGVVTLQTDLPVTETGGTVVDITADISDGLLAQLRATGAEVMTIVPERDSVRAAVSIDILESIAAIPAVRFIQPRQDAMTSGVTEQVTDDRNGTKASTRPEFANRVANVRSLLSAALEGGETGESGLIPPTGVGSRTSEGDVTHRVASARGTFHTDGTGVKIGILSNGVTNLAASQALGDLGPVTILPGQAGSGDEGTAMLEIVHDLAPGAQLYFATALTSITSFAQNIRDLRTAGCDIIIDDVFYFVETPFQDGQPGPTNTNGGVVIQAVNDVTAAGALYFSSAGNSGNLSDGTSGAWEGDFVDGGPTAAPIPLGNRLHAFIPAVQNFNVLNAANTAAPISLYWSDPLGASSNDYDLFRLNATGTTVQASSTNIQSGTQDPYEQVGQAAGSRIVIVKKAAAAGRFLHLNTNRGRLSIATSGTTHGHSAAANAFSCAATPANLAFGAAPNPVGPFPNAFGPTNVTELFSSDGPRRVFFQANGTSYGPGGIVRQKPDITAADGTVVTGVGNFGSPFYGTSAAAPHAGAIAALLKSANPLLTAAQIRAALTSSAIDIETPGVDRDSGAGIIMPYAALQAAGVSGTAFLEFGSITASEDPGDGNGLIDAGDGANLVIQLRNSGVNAATAISATLSSSTPGITVHQPNLSAYPDLAAGGGSANNLTPFRFTVGSAVSCPTTLQFTLTVTFTGGVSPQVMNFSVPTGPGPVNITSTLDLTAPSGPRFTGSTGTIAVRHFRDGAISSCGTNKPFPGTSSPGTRQYDAYTFQTCASSAPACITVTLNAPFNGTTGNPSMFTAAYLGNFNPANLAQNYVADPGSSAASRTYSFNIPGGAQTFTIVVYDVNAQPASNSTYSLNISGSCIGSCAPANQVPVAKAKNVTVPAGPDCTANASVDDGSFDPDGDPLTITQTPAGPYPIGTTNVVLTVKDPRGATSQATATVTVEDTTPPDVSAVSASPNSLWTPNHEMVPVTVEYSATEGCSGDANCVLTVSSNEPTNGLGDGDSAPDWQIVDAHHLMLRAERGGGGSGRVYTITITCTDAAGNQTVRTTTVNVPKSQAKAVRGQTSRSSSSQSGTPSMVTTQPVPTTQGVTADLANRQPVFVGYIQGVKKPKKKSAKYRLSSRTSGLKRE